VVVFHTPERLLGHIMGREAATGLASAVGGRLRGHEHHAFAPRVASCIRFARPTGRDPGWGGTAHSRRCPRINASSPSVMANISRPDQPELDSAPPAHARRKRALAAVPKMSLPIELCTAQSAIRIGPPASAGRNALPVSRVRTAFVWVPLALPVRSHPEISMLELGGFAVSRFSRTWVS
jgi:hypothetical protein